MSAMSSNELVAAARAEEAKLLQELDAIQHRLKAVRGVLSLYRPGHARKTKRESYDQHNRNPQPHTKAGKIAVAAELYLRQEHRRATSVEIAAALKERGVEELSTLNGHRATTYIAAVLSHHAGFDNVRGAGYGLTEWLHDGETKL